MASSLRAMILTGETSHRLAQKYGFLAVLAIVLTLPFAVPALLEPLRERFHWDIVYLLRPVENQTYMLLISVCVAGLLYGLWRIADPPIRLPRNSLVWLVLLFAIMEFVGAVGSDHPDYTLRAMLMPFVFFAGFYLTQTLELTPRSIDKVFLLCVAAAIPISLYAVAQSQGWEFLPYSKFVSDSSTEEISGKQLISSLFGHPNYLSSYISPLAFWSLYFVLARGRQATRAIGLVAFLSILAALVVGGARGGWLAVAGAALPFYILLTLSPTYRRQLLFAGGLGIVLAGILVFVRLPFLRLHFDLSQRFLASKEIAARFYYWLIALEMFKDHPWLGVGYGNFNTLFWDYVNGYQKNPESQFFRFILESDIRGVSPGYVHNDFLQIAAESGVLSLFSWFAIWSAFICQAWETARAAKNDHRILLLSATLLASCVAMGIDGLTNFPLHIPVSGFLFWVTLGCWTALREYAGRITRGPAL